jgi:hypothetical protein
MPVLSRDHMIEDLMRLTGLLVDSHPDPYRGFGGPVGFFRQATAIARQIPDHGSPDEFLALIRPLVAGVRDGHTTIGIPPASQTARARIFLDLGIVEDSLYVRTVYAPEHLDLLGARVLEMGGVSMPELLDRVQSFVGCDNLPDALRRVRRALADQRFASGLMGAEHVDPLKMTFELPHGARSTRFLPWLEAAPGPGSSPLSAVNLPALGPHQLGWGFLDHHRQVACLRVGSLTRYREAGEVWRHAGFRAGLVNWFREATGCGDPTDDQLDAFLRSAPSATDLLQEMISAMVSAATPWVIVDCSQTPGGNSALATMLGVALFGQDAVSKMDSGYQIPRYSALYAENYGRIPAGAQNFVGGYDFREEVKWRARRDQGSPPAEEMEAHEWLDSVPSFRAALDGGRLPAIAPTVSVVTSADTYSAGFDIALTLRALGATHVGSPSAQAPNCFIDVLRFKLPHSGVEGTISFKESFALPGRNLPERLLEPDVVLTHDRLKAFGFDPAAGVRLALEDVVGIPCGQPAPPGHP